MNLDTSNSINSCRSMIVYEPIPQEKMSVFLRLLPFIREIQIAHHENFINKVGLYELASLHVVPTGPVMPGGKNNSLLHVFSTHHQLAMTTAMMGIHTALRGFDIQGRPYIAIKVNLFDATTGEKITQFVEVIFRRYALAVKEPQKKEAAEDLETLIFQLHSLVKDARIDDIEILKRITELNSLAVNEKLDEESVKELLNISEDLIFRLESFKFKLPEGGRKLEDKISEIGESISTLSSFKVGSLSIGSKLDNKSTEEILKVSRELTSRLNSLIIDSKLRGIPLGEKPKEEILKVLNKIHHSLLIFRRESMTVENKFECKPKEKRSKEESYASALWNRGDDGEAYTSCLYAPEDMSDKQFSTIGKLLRGERVPYIPNPSQVSHSMVDILKKLPFKYGSNYVMQRAKM